MKNFNPSLFYTQKHFKKFKFSKYTFKIKTQFQNIMTYKKYISFFAISSIYYVAIRFFNNELELTFKDCIENQKILS